MGNCLLNCEDYYQYEVKNDNNNTCSKCENVIRY